MTRQLKRGLTPEKGDEVSFYRGGEVLLGRVNYVGEDSVSLFLEYPDSAEAQRSGVGNAEINIPLGDIL